MQHLFQLVGLCNVKPKEMCCGNHSVIETYSAIRMHYRYTLGGKRNLTNNI